VGVDLKALINGHVACKCLPKDEPKSECGGPTGEGDRRTLRSGQRKKRSTENRHHQTGKKRKNGTETWKNKQKGRRHTWKGEWRYKGRGRKNYDDEKNSLKGTYLGREKNTREGQKTEGLT